MLRPERVVTAAAVLFFAAACQRQSEVQPVDSGTAPAAAMEGPKTDAPREGPPAELPPAMVSYREGDAAFAAGDHAKAIEKAQAATRADPSLTIAWNLLGRAQAQQFAKSRDAAAAKQAHAAFERAVKLDPNFLPAWQNLAELYEREGRMKDAAEAYGKVLAIAPDHPEKARLEAFIRTAGATQ